MPRSPKKQKWTPQFEGVLEGWVVNGMRGNYWRVERILTREEYMQEAYLMFLTLKERYTDVVDPPHFTALFKTSWVNQLNDFAKADTRSRMFVQAEPLRDEEGEDMDILELGGELDCDGHLAVLLRQAPREIKEVLNLFLSAPQEIVDAALGSWNGGDKRFARTHGGSRRICLLLGLNPDRDIMKEVHDYFQVA